MLSTLRAWVGPRPNPSASVIAEALARRERQLANPVIFAPYTRYSGLGSDTQPNPQLLLRESLGWAATATRAISDRVASISGTVEVCRRRRVAGREELDPIPDHPLTRILRSGSPVHRPSMLYRVITQHILTLGEAYLFKVRGTMLPVPVELWLGQAANIRPLIDSTGIVYAVEVFDGQGARSTVAASEFVRIWWPDPESLYTSEGILGPQAITSDALKFSSQTLREHFGENAIPRIVMEAAETVAGPDAAQIDRLNETIRQRFDRRSGPQRAVPYWAPAGFKAHELSLLGGVQEFVPMLNAWTEQMLAAFGVPKSVLGLTDDTGLGRATAETNQYVMDVRAVKPLVDLISEALTIDLAQKDFGPDLVVRFPEFAPEDKEFALARDKTLLDTKQRSINELRERDGLDEVEWGDLPVGQIGESPYDGSLPMPALAPDNPAAFGAPSPASPSGEEPPRMGHEAAQLDRGGGADPLVRASWVRFVARERKWVPPAQRAMSSILGIQERAVLKALRDYGLERSQKRISDADVMALIRAVLAPERWARAFYQRFEPVRRSAFLESGQQALGLVGGKPASFQLTAAINQLLSGQAEVFRALVSNTTLKAVSDKVMQALRDGAEAGDSLSERAARVEKAVGDSMTLRRNQSATIARTEMLVATEKAQVEGFRLSGVVEKKQWNTSRDDAVRDSHQIDGESVLLDGYFTLADGERADAPGVGSHGGRLSAGNSINCRCFVTPVIETQHAEAAPPLERKPVRKQVLRDSKGLIAEIRLASADSEPTPKSRKRIVRDDKGLIAEIIEE